MKYEDALQAVQKILSDIENEEISIDDLLDKVKAANNLIAVCKQKLRNVEMALNDDK